ncbi:MAG TPA: c-type cytochrome biogenesis protein CcsB [Bacteroidales bacterium]|nr:c-type cytochrome biogenesis protein CcsB [Bacteroidales bacterium]
MKYIKFLFTPVMMGILFVIFALSMAVATFLENDFGSAAAYSMVYDSRWFELILILLAANLIGMLINYNMFRKQKLPVALFHLAFIMMIAGAGITRYFGWEGNIHIREGESQDECYSTVKRIGYTLKDNNGSAVSSDSRKYTLTSVSADNYSNKININNREYQLDLSRIIPNAAEEITDVPGGEPIISLMVTKDMTSQESVILKRGEKKEAYGINIGFDVGDADINITLDSAAFFANSESGIGVMSMMSHGGSSAEMVNRIALKQMQILTCKGVRIIPEKMITSGHFKAVAVNPKETNTKQNAFIFNIFSGNESETIYLWDKENAEYAEGSCVIDNHTLVVSYGSDRIKLPFSIKLNDFILERYPGSSSPSGYKSDVVLIDESNNVEKPYLIFMNNILKYKGYRFYQSSFDPDEKGTILSVNHDMAGMLVTYTGYAFMMVFIILALISRRSIFRNITAGHWNSLIRKTAPVILLLFITGLQGVEAQKLVPDRKAAEEFGKVLVQDQKGRTEPLFTLSHDILRKVTRENRFEGMTPMQVFLGLYLDFDNWKDYPIIRVSNEELKKVLGVRGKYAAFSDIVNIQDGTYKISEDVTKAYAKAPGERSRLDKEMMKVDERINIVYMIYNSDFLKLFPKKDGTHDWGNSQAALVKAVNNDDSTYLKGIMPILSEAIHNNNITTVKQVANSITDYQTRFSGYKLPSEGRTKIELLYFKMSFFERLFPFYATVGLVLLIVLITTVIRGSKVIPGFIKVLEWLLLAGFIFHTIGLGLRWYISGHSPMSNGYESMIFISWVTLLAGFIFRSKSAFALSATAVLGAMTLMVAHLSFMDPEITNLVPVLKSYWLTLHVSVITGSYGFLGLGAILGLISMILLVLSNDRNRTRISNTIDELTIINYKTLTLGLYLLTIGTFLGAIWANESWGRYWGWDPKETWSLITIIIYSIVVHSRNIPGMKDVYTFNLISLFAFSSVLMTYFGVNYYLSGLHSYAGGDPVPVPTFVYVAVILLTSLSIAAYYRYAAVRKKG